MVNRFRRTKIINELGNPIKHQLSKFDDLHEYLLLKYPLLKVEIFDLMPFPKLKNGVLNDKGLKIRIQNICSDFQLVTLKEAQAQKSSIKK